MWRFGASPIPATAFLTAVPLLPLRPRRFTIPSICKMPATSEAPVPVEALESKKRAQPMSLEAVAPSASAAAPALRVKFLSEHAQLPKRGSPAAAGYDLYSAEDTVVAAAGRGVVKTDISIRIPEGTYARIAPRSGLAVKKGINTGAGVIDYDYRGPVGVVLFNHGEEEFKVAKGDRIAQMILERIVTPEVLQVEELDETERGEGGFGSTGVSDAKREKKE